MSSLSEESRTCSIKLMYEASMHLSMNTQKKATRFSVIGCSIGAGLHNEKMAKTRAEKVRNVLITTGVAEDHIVSEACWSGEDVAANGTAS